MRQLIQLLSSKYRKFLHWKRKKKRQDIERTFIINNFYGMEADWQTMLVLSAKDLESHLQKPQLQATCSVKVSTSPIWSANLQTTVSQTKLAILGWCSYAKWHWEIVMRNIMLTIMPTYFQMENIQQKAVAKQLLYRVKIWAMFTYQMVLENKLTYLKDHCFTINSLFMMLPRSNVNICSRWNLYILDSLFLYFILLIFIFGIMAIHKQIINALIQNNWKKSQHQSHVHDFFKVVHVLELIEILFGYRHLDGIRWRIIFLNLKFQICF